MKRKASDAAIDSESNFSSSQPTTNTFSSRHDTNTNTPVTSPGNSRNSDTGSQGWGWDCNSMPTVTLPAAPAAASPAPIDSVQQPPLKKQHVAQPPPPQVQATTTRPVPAPMRAMPQHPMFANPILAAAGNKPIDMDAFFASRPRMPQQQSVEEGYKRSLEHFPNPGLMFPMPSLEFDFRISVKLNPELSRAENRVHKEIITVASGSWSGSFGNGRVLAGGYDLGQARGYRPIRIVEGAFVLQTSDQVPAIFEMRTRGSLSGPCNILDTLLSPQSPKEIDPRQYSFRMFSTVKAADRRYAEIVNCGLWVACGVWKGDELIIDAYRVI